MIRKRIEAVIMWTGDNRDEMIDFCPDLLEYPYDYPDWPEIGVIGILDRRGNPQEMGMRDYLVRTYGGEYRIIKNHE